MHTKSTLSHLTGKCNNNDAENRTHPQARRNTVTPRCQRVTVNTLVATWVSLFSLIFWNVQIFYKKACMCIHSVRERENSKIYICFKTLK